MADATFTVGDVFNALLYICGLIGAVAVAAGVVLKVANFINRPNSRQNERISALEKRMEAYDKRMEEHDSFFRQDKDRLDGIERSNQLIIKGIIALTDHALNGNEMSTLTDYKKTVNEYLTEMK